MCFENNMNFELKKYTIEKYWKVVVHDLLYNASSPQNDKQLVSSHRVSQTYYEN